MTVAMATAPMMYSMAMALSVAAAAANLAASPAPTNSSAWPLPQLGWSSANGTLPNGFAPAYLASGLFGVRVPRYALGGSVCMGGDRNQCSGDRTVQCLVGGYEHRQVSGCTVGCDHPDENLGGARTFTSNVYIPAFNSSSLIDCLC